MTRLWRAAVLALVATALVVGPASAVSATEGNRGDAPHDRATDRPVDRAGNGPLAGVVDQPTDAVDRPAERDRDRDRDRVTDRAVDRPKDRVTDRESDRVGDRITDRVRDRVQRPECDPDEVTDRVHDCREPDDQIRPALARCMEYVQNHTDIVIKRSLRWWWHVCHRIAWNHNNPE